MSERNDLAAPTTGVPETHHPRLCPQGEAWVDLRDLDLDALARQAAIGAAVERLPRTGDEAIWLIRDVSGRWEAQVVYPLLERPKRSSMREATLPEAIAAALEAPTDDR